jgi:hypothetical protein
VVVQGSLLVSDGRVEGSGWTSWRGCSSASRRVRLVEQVPVMDQTALLLTPA